jgi:putative molybdopterin biosynthesis protein
MIADTMAGIVACMVERIRRSRGLTQETLARAAGITRQAVGAIENGRMQPSVGIAIALARALGVAVEDLFVREPPQRPERVARATIGGKVVAHALDAEHLAIEPAQIDLPAVFLAGCDLAVGMLSRHAMLLTQELRVLWLTMTNREALNALRRGRVHAAVVHGDAVTVPNGGFARFELATTQEGWLVARDNPLEIHAASDLERRRVRFVNRPDGSGARQLLDATLRRANVDPRRLNGYGRTVPGQLDAGRAVAQGFADVAVGMASVARIYNLQFIALREERSTLVVPLRMLRSREIRVLLEALRSSAYRRDVESLDAYDISQTGERIA